MAGQNNDELHKLSAADPGRKEQLQKRGRLNWNLHKPNQGPASLAFKNRQYNAFLDKMIYGFNDLRLDFIAMIGEYVGTVLFMMFALGGTKYA